MTPQLEKVFLNYILNYKKYFDIVKPFFFRNSEIQFVYGVIRDYMIKSSDSKIPSPRQILDMISLEDKEGIQILGVNQTFETNYLIEII